MARRSVFGAFVLVTALVALPSFAAPAVGVDLANNLIRFDTATPTVITTTPITGLSAGDSIVGIDYRPATFQVFALGTSGGTARLYTLNIQTGAATLVATVSTTLTSVATGTDFNPTVDRFRVVNDADQNLRIVPDTGAATVDTALQFAATDVNAAANPNVTAVAYTNNVAGATTTTLYGIDTNLNILVTQIPPNSGTLNTIGPLGFDTSAITGFDIEGGTGSAFAALNVGAGTQLYSINLTSGAATLIGVVGAGTTLNAFTIIPQAVAASAIPLLSPKILLLLGAVLAAIGALTIAKGR